LSGTSWAGIIAIVVVIVAGLGAWLVLIALAAKRPYFEHPKIIQRQGGVRGGIHEGDPGRVAPRRDAPANPSDR
jgi:hypothetical protein